MSLFIRNRELRVILFLLVSLHSFGARAQDPAAGAPASGDGAVKPPLRLPDVSREPQHEDWNTLAIPSSATFPDPPPGLKSDFPDYTKEFVQLMWRSSDLIDLYVLKPKGVEKPPVVLYLYSFPSDTARFNTDAFAKLATNNGFAAVGFVSALTGYRFHDRPTREWFVSELQEALGSSVHDVQFVLNYLAKRGDLDMSHVGMFGDGSGASIAIMAAAVDPRIKTLDLFNPWGDWPDWLAHSTLVPEEERATYLKPEFLKKVENLDPVKWLPQLKTQQVRLQFLKDDTINPQTAKERVAAVAPVNAKVVQYESSKTFLKDVAFPGKTFDWVKQQRSAQEKAEPTGAKQPSPMAKTSDH
jgi:hypothetical protein